MSIYSVIFAILKMSLARNIEYLYKDLQSGL